MLGEVALYSFVILILTGIFLTFWFKPSMADVEYQGSYGLLKGLHMSDALVLGIIEGFIGYGLPDDLLSGTGLGITNGMIQAAPVIGT